MIQQLCSLVYIPKDAENLCPHKTLNMNVYSRRIHSCQNLEATRDPSVGE